MIAVKDDFPLVCHPGGYVTAFDAAWLRNALICAAGKAGYHKWWLADHVTQSVAGYLRTQFEENVVTTARLEKTVRSVLQVIGYAEVADHFLSPAPPVWISLPELAGEAGAGYELVFFELLGGRLEQLMGEKVTNLEIHGLHPCVKTLRGRKSWRRNCRELRDEIIHFVRKKIDRHSIRDQVVVTVH